MTVTTSNASGQGGEACPSGTLDKTSIYAGSNEANWIINVTAPSTTCTWTATSSDPSWLVVKSTVPTPPAGSGYVKVRAVTNTCPKRTGYFIVGGVVYTVTQGGI